MYRLNVTSTASWCDTFGRYSHYLMLIWVSVQHYP